MEVMLLRAEDIQKALGLGRSKVYEMIQSGELPIIRVGRSVRVPAAGLRAWIAQRVEQQGAIKEASTPTEKDFEPDEAT